MAQTTRAMLLAWDRITTSSLLAEVTLEPGVTVAEIMAAISAMTAEPDEDGGEIRSKGKLLATYGQADCLAEDQEIDNVTFGAE